jgi:hypothetical protein
VVEVLEAAAQDLGEHAPFVDGAARALLPVAREEAMLVATNAVELAIDPEAPAEAGVAQGEQEGREAPVEAHPVPLPGTCYLSGCERPARADGCLCPLHKRRLDALLAHAAALREQPSFFPIDLGARITNRASEKCARRRVHLATDMAAEFEFARARGHTVLLRVSNCLGGHATAAVDIFSAIEQHRAAGLQVVVEISGQAKSAASILPLAADFIAILPSARVAVHAPALEQVPESIEARSEALAWRSPRRFFDLALSGEGLSARNMVRAIYSQWTLGGAAEIDGWLGEDFTVFDAPSAVRLGFADEVAGWGRAEEVALAYARGEAVRSPRREALAVLGRGDVAVASEMRSKIGRAE